MDMEFAKEIRRMKAEELKGAERSHRSKSSVRIKDQDLRAKQELIRREINQAERERESIWKNSYNCYNFPLSFSSCLHNYSSSLNSF